MTDPARATHAIIVGGCYRSGTSLLRRMLNAHPRIHCPPEITFFRDLHGDFVDDPLRHLRFTTTARSLADEATLTAVLGRAFVRLHELAATRAGKPRWADKSPDNVLYVDKWAELLGDEWLFVHMLRNPLDTLASMETVRFPLTLPPTTDGRIELYARYAEAGLSFRRAHPGRAAIICYEDLVDDPAATLDLLMRFLGEDAHAMQLRFNDQEQGEGLEDPKVAATAEAVADRVGSWSDVLSRADAALISERLDALHRACVAAALRPTDAGRPSAISASTRSRARLRR